jgi:hypothetical protein
MITIQDPDDGQRERACDCECCKEHEEREEREERLARRDFYLRVVATCGGVLAAAAQFVQYFPW